MGLEKHVRHVGLNKARQTRELKKAQGLEGKKKNLMGLFWARPEHVWTRAVGYARLNKKKGALVVPACGPSQALV